MHELEDIIIRLNQAADLAEMTFVEGKPQEYLIDCLIQDIRILKEVFYKKRNIY